MRERGPCEEVGFAFSIGAPRGVRLPPLVELLNACGDALNSSDFVILTRCIKFHARSDWVLKNIRQEKASVFQAMEAHGMQLGENSRGLRRDSRPLQKK